MPNAADAVPLATLSLPTAVAPLPLALLK